MRAGTYHMDAVYVVRGLTPGGEGTIDGPFLLVVDFAHDDSEETARDCRRVELPGPAKDALDTFGKGASAGGAGGPAKGEPALVDLLRVILPCSGNTSAHALVGCREREIMPKHGSRSSKPGTPDQSTCQRTRPRRPPPR